MNLPEKHIKFNLPQLLASQATQKYQSLEWGRGGGKSTILGLRVKEIVKQMPRSKTGIVGATYQQLLTRTLPSTIEGLELLGFYKDIHYYVGTRPPKHWRWDEPHQPPLRYDHFISFYNGAGFQLISLDSLDSGRGLNLDAVIGDEALTFDKEKLENNVLLSNRGNIHRYKHTWLHHSELFASTTPYSLKGRWFINLEEMARKDPANYFHLRAESTYNLENLGSEYFRSLKRKLTPLAYNTEVMCIRPGKAETGFYPSFNESIHCQIISNDSYVLGLNMNLDKLRGRIPDADLIQTAPLDVACDYGANINTLVCGQLNAGNLYRILNALFVKSPLTISNLAQEFCDYYQFHRNKTVNYYYDHTAQYLDAVRTKTFADVFTDVLTNNGWKVNRIYCGKAPMHATKYIFFDSLFKRDNPSLPDIRFNQENCKYLTISILQAGAKEGRNGIEKDKNPEKKKNVIDEETTHFSDAFDTLVFFKFKDVLQGGGYMVHAAF